MVWVSQFWKKGQTSGIDTHMQKTQVLQWLFIIFSTNASDLKVYFQCVIFWILEDKDLQWFGDLCTTGCVETVVENIKHE